MANSLLIFFFVATLLGNNVKSDSFSFSFSKFEPNDGFNLGFLGDARPYGGAILLTKRDGPDGTTLRQNSVGRVLYIPPVRLWDKNTNKIADFTTEFTFVVDPAGSRIHGDGFAFFMIPYESDPRIPTNSTGGYLGLFSPEKAFNTQKNQIVAVEFDSFGNEWDPVFNPIAPHVGIDVNSLESVVTGDWVINSVPEGSFGKARISYDSKAKKLFVLVSYDNTSEETFITQVIDLRDFLPEWVRIGFSASTGNSVESHDLVSWSFTSST